MSKDFENILINAVKNAAKGSVVEKEVNESLKVELTRLNLGTKIKPMLEFNVEFNSDIQGKKNCYSGILNLENEVSDVIEEFEDFNENNLHKVN